MFFRRNQKSETIEVTYAQMRALVGQGDVPPDAMVCDPLLTQGQWWTIDNLRLYHQCSPEPHLPGKHLLIHDAARKAMEADLAAAQLQREPDSPLKDFLGMRVALPSLGWLSEEPGLLGASRLTVHHRVFVVTLIFKPSAIEVERMFETYPPVPFGWQDDEGKRFREAVVEKGQLAYEETHELMRSWSHFVSFARDAEVDGTNEPPSEAPILHELFDPGEPNEVIESYQWLSGLRGNRRRTELVQAYGECLEAAGLESPFGWMGLDSL